MGVNNAKHKDLKSLETASAKPKVKLSALAGKLSYKTEEAMLKFCCDRKLGITAVEFIRLIVFNVIRIITGNCLYFKAPWSGN
jgi:hypothetical protein